MNEAPLTCYSVMMDDFIPWFLEETPRPESWDDLYSQYISLRENKSALFILGLIKEITFLKAKYKIIEEACKMMGVCFINNLVDAAAELKTVLRLYNFRQPFDMNNELTFSRDIRAVLSANKKTITTWQRKEKELEDYQAKHTGKAWDRKGFYVWAITLGEHQGYRIDLKVTSVAEWCQLLNKYDRYCEVVNAQQNSKQYGQRK